MPMSSTEAVTLLVLFGTGSKYETKRINGISHFLEHLFFKGTKHRPSPGEVNKALDRMGAEHNAFTSKEVTGYWVKAAAKHLDSAIDIVSDILTEPLFKKEEIEKERGVILQEISMYEDWPQRKIGDAFESLLYGDQPAGWEITGTPAIIKTIQRSDILKYRNEHYLAPNAIVSVAGNINQKEVFKKIGKAFKKIPRGASKTKQRVKEKQFQPRVNLIFKESDQTHLIFGFRGLNMYDENRYALNLLGVILGGNMSSRLFMEIREKLGLAYYVGAAGEQYTDSGYLAAKAGVPHGKLETVINKIIEIVKDLRERGVSEEEVRFAKDYIRGMMALSFESSDEVATFCAEQELFHKKVLTPEEIFKKIESVSKNDIMKVVKNVFMPRKSNLAVIGPHRDASKYEHLLKEL